MTMRLQGKVVAFLVAEGVEDLEYYVPLMRLEEEGAQTITAALDLQPLRGKNGLLVKPAATIAALDPERLDGLVVPGGWAPDRLRRYPEVTGLVRALDDRKRTLAFICHGGQVAISAGILHGSKAGGTLAIRDDLINAGATWVDAPAFRDGHRVWGRVVADIPAFCRELVAALVSGNSPGRRG